jgi:hypothetical protein
MPEEPRWRRDGRFPFQDVQGMTVVVVPAKREVHRLEESASFVWGVLATASTVADLVAAVCDEFDVDEKTAGKDVRDLLAELEGKGLVIRA